MAENISTGTGLEYPLRREHGDYATVSGSRLIAANIRKILGVDASSSDGVLRGEYPWRLDFGTQIRRVLHSDISDAFAHDLVQVYVIDAIERWEPRAIITTVGIDLDDLAGGRRAKITVKFRVDTGQLGQTPVESMEAIVD